MPSKTQILSLDQKNSQLKVKAFELDSPVVFNYFDKLPENERDDKFLKAIYIGTLALMEDRLSAFLSKTQNELSVELLSLKMIFDMKKEIFFKSAVKGILAENDIVDFLNGWFKESKINDTAEGTGTTAGVIKGNKTGDIVCKVADTDKSIVIEVKFDKGYKMGDIAEKDIFTKKIDTAWGQILEAKANRDSAVGIIVFDKDLVDNSITKAVSDVGFIRGIGFVAIVNSQANDFKNLAIAYGLARDIVLNAREYETSPEILTIVVKRILKDLNGLKSLEKQVKSIQSAAKNILEELDKGMLSVEFTLQYLEKFLADGKLTKDDLFNFYNADEVRKKFTALEVKGLIEN